MKKAARPGGQIMALDYDHEDNRWEPEPPAEFARFYRAFLDWRAANGWDNRRAERLLDLFRAAGLKEVRASRSDEVALQGQDGFEDAASVWLYVIEAMGANIAAAGFLTEAETAAAARVYREFVAGGLERQTLRMRTVEVWLRPLKPGAHADHFGVHAFGELPGVADSVEIGEARPARAARPDLVDGLSQQDRTRPSSMMAGGDHAGANHGCIAFHLPQQHSGDFAIDHGDR